MENNKQQIKQQSLIKNAFLNTARTVLGIIFPLITFPYISHVLQVEAIGVYNFSYSIVSYFSLLAGLGISTYAIREGTQYRDDRKKITQFVSEIFSINIFSTLVSYFLFFIVILIIKKLQDYKLAITILSLEIIFTTIGVNWIYNIFEDFLFITLQSLCVQFVSLILTVTLVRNPNDLYIYIGIIVFVRAVSGIVNFIYAKINYCDFKLTFKCKFKKHIKSICIFFSTAIAVTIYVNSDITMIGFFADDYQVGLYSTAVKIYTIAKNVLAAIGAVFVPRFSYLFNNNNKNQANNLFSDIFNMFIIFIFPVTIGLFMFSKDIIQLVGGIKFLDATSSLQLLSIAITFSMFAYLFTQCILIPEKKENIVFIATLVSAFFNIVLNFIFIPLWGINGAAITTIIAEVIVCFICGGVVKHDVKIIDVGKNIITVIIGCIGICLVSLVIKRIIDNFIIRLFVSIITCVVIYGGVLLLFKNKVAITIIKSLQAKLIHKNDL